jgi:hypothetical protein
MEAAAVNARPCRKRHQPDEVQRIQDPLPGRGFATPTLGHHRRCAKSKLAGDAFWDRI